MMAVDSNVHGFLCTTVPNGFVSMCIVYMNVYTFIAKIHNLLSSYAFRVLGCGPLFDMKVLIGTHKADRFAERVLRS